MLQTLKQNGLDKLVARVRDEVADIERKVEALRDCPADPAKPACQVSYRFIVQVSRNTPIEDVFTQTAFAAALVRAEPRVVALNFVQTEDNQIARRDYTKHMEIVRFLASDVKVALHAGELWIGLVPPTDLTFHIRQAVEIAGARRIGHGTALAFEHDVGACSPNCAAAPSPSRSASPAAMSSCRCAARTIRWRPIWPPACRWCCRPTIRASRGST